MKGKVKAFNIVIVIQMAPSGFYFTGGMGSSKFGPSFFLFPSVYLSKFQLDKLKEVRLELTTSNRLGHVSMKCKLEEFYTWF